MSRPVNLPVLPPPNRTQYDANNEAQFRTTVERILRNLATSTVQADPSLTGELGRANFLVKWGANSTLGVSKISESTAGAFFDEAVTISKTLSVVGTAAVGGAASIGGGLTVGDTLDVYGVVTFRATGTNPFNVLGDAWFQSTGNFEVDADQVSFVGTANFDVQMPVTLESTVEVSDLATFETGAAFGVLPALTGAIRLSYGQGVVARNSANTADLTLLSIQTGAAANALSFGGIGVGDIQLRQNDGTKWFFQGSSPYDLLPWDNTPSNDNRQSLGSSTSRLKNGWFGTGLFSPLLDSQSGDLTLKRAGVLQLTLAASAATFVGTVSGTQYTSTVSTGTAPLVVASQTVVTNLNADLLDGQHGAYYAPLASPTFTGTPTAPTALAGTNTTQLATTAFVQAATAALVTGVSSVFGRTGAVVAATNDYNFTQLAGSLSSSQLSGDYTFPANAITTGYLNGLTGGYFGQTQATFTAAWGAGAPAFFADTGAAILRQANGGTLNVGRVNGTFGSPTSIANGDILGVFQFVGYDTSTSGVVAPSQVRSRAREAWTGVGRGANVEVLTTPNGSPSSSRVTTAYFDQDGTLSLGASSHSQTYDLYAANVQVGGQLISSVATGTAPLVVSSTTLVANLHAASADTSTTQSAGNNSTSIATTAYVDRASGLSSTSVAAPTLTTSTVGVMMGLKLAFTPTRGTKAIVVCTGGWANSVLADGVTIQLRFGTGTAPNNAAALTGTAFGSAKTFKEAVATDTGAFALAFPVTGLTVGTTYWFDISLAAVTGGNASVTNVDIFAMESA